MGGGEGPGEGAAGRERHQPRHLGGGDLYLADQRFEFGQRNHAGAQQHGRLHQREHRGFDAHARRAAIQHVVGERFRNVGGGRGREFGEAVGAGRGDGHAGGADQLERHRVRGHAQADRGQTGGDDVRNSGALRDHQRQRAGPVAARKGFGRVRPDGGQGARHLDGIDVDDQRAGPRAALGGEDARHRGGVQRVGAQAVDRFGGKRHQSSRRGSGRRARRSLRTHSGSLVLVVAGDLAGLAPDQVGVDQRLQIAFQHAVHIAEASLVRRSLTMR